MGVKKQTSNSDKINRSSEIMAQLLASSVITWIWIGTFCMTAITPLIVAGRVHSDGPSLGFEPEFTESMTNVTVATGRDAVLSCSVANLGGHKVGWVKADTKAIQAIHLIVVTHNPRVSVEHIGSSQWKLIIKNVRKEDAGFYMAQISDVLGRDRTTGHYRRADTWRNSRSGERGGQVDMRGQR